MVLVGKKDVFWRLCVDYTDINQMITKDKFPISIMEDLSEEFGGGGDA